MSRESNASCVAAFMKFSFVRIFEVSTNYSDYFIPHFNGRISERIWPISIKNGRHLCLGYYWVEWIALEPTNHSHNNASNIPQSSQMICHNGRGCIFPDKIALMYGSHKAHEIRLTCIGMTMSLVGLWTMETRNIRLNGFIEWMVMNSNWVPLLVVVDGRDV